MFKIKLSNNASLQKIYIWNALGSVCNAASSILLLMVVTRFSGEIIGGIFSIAFAIAQQMLTVASFESGTYQVTDGKNVYRFKTYLSSRLALYFISVLFGLLLAVFSGYSSYKTAVVTLVCAYKGLDSFNATFGAALQKHGRLDVGGKSFALRIVISFVIFTACQYFADNLIISLVAATLFSVGWIIVYEMGATANFENIELDFSVKNNILLLIECVPLFLGSFLMMIMSTLPKYAVDSLLDNETLNNAFGIIFMPSAVISLLSIFIFRPELTGLTNAWNNGDKSYFCRRIIKLSVFVLGASLVCLAFAAVFGIWALELVYGVELGAYKTALLITMAGGAMYALSNLIYNAIVILRRQKLMIIAYVLASVISAIISYPMVKKWTITGAAVSYLLSTSVLALLMTVLLLILVNKKEK